MITLTAQIEQLKAYLEKQACPHCDYWGNKLIKLLQDLDNIGLKLPLSGHNKEFSSFWAKYREKNKFNEYQNYELWFWFCGNAEISTLLEHTHKEYSCQIFPWGLNGERDWKAQDYRRKTTIELLNNMALSDPNFNKEEALEKMEDIFPKFPEISIEESAKITFQEVKGEKHDSSY